MLVQNYATDCKNQNKSIYQILFNNINLIVIIIAENNFIIIIVLQK